MKHLPKLIITTTLLILFTGISSAQDRNDSNTPYIEKQIYGRVIPNNVKIIYENLDKRLQPVLLNPTDIWDWRSMGGVTPVKDQGMCGSCWDFAAVGAVESAVMIADGAVWDLSEQQVIDCNASGYGCRGGWEEAAYQLFIDYGAIDEYCYPYYALDLFPCEQDSCIVMIKIDSYVYVQNNINAIKNELLNGPVVSGISMPHGFHWNCFEGSGNGLDHAIVIVGWDDNLCDSGAWIVKDSRGIGWGNSGFLHVPYNSVGIGSYTNRPIYEGSLPEITCRPDRMVFNVNPSGTTTDTLHLGNTGTGDLYYRLRFYNFYQPPGRLGWLEVENDHGMISPVEFSDIVITCNPGDLGEGTYNGVIDVYNNDPYSYHMEIPVTMNVGYLSVDSNDVLPESFSSIHNHPNPFNNSTTISFNINNSGHVTVDVFNILGNKVDRIDDRIMSAGQHQVVWSAEEQPSGVYIYKIQSGGQVGYGKMSLMK
ncbi:MAG: T9SS type A sorting domain-containing protein [candidate division Zixibacteria bacterium]|nr:T9SS type A sorting domain-containing protein [candidate division Zixibacteria bacterium]